MQTFFSHINVFFQFSQSIFHISSSFLKFKECLAARPNTIIQIQAKATCFLHAFSCGKAFKKRSSRKYNFSFLFQSIDTAVANGICINLNVFFNEFFHGAVLYFAATRTHIYTCVLFLLQNNFLCCIHQFIKVY